MRQLIKCHGNDLVKISSMEHMFLLLYYILLGSFLVKAVKVDSQQSIGEVLSYNELELLRKFLYHSKLPNKQEVSENSMNFNIN